MPRIKDVWLGRVAGKATKAPGNRVKVPVTLDHDPTRVVEVTIARSRASALARQILRATEDLDPAA